MAQWGVSMPADFTGRPGVLYNEGGSFEQQLEQIMLQKYFAYFFVDYQSWFEKEELAILYCPGDRAFRQRTSSRYVYLILPTCNRSTRLTWQML